MIFKCRKIEGFNKYYVTNNGDIYSSKRKELLLMTPKKDKLGYLHLAFYQNKKAHYISVHREVAKAFVFNSKYQEVNHIDGVKTNNSEANLEWCSRSENILHAYKEKLKTNKGEINPSSKLKVRDVLEIKDLLSKGFNCREISDLYPVSHHAIHKIKIGKNWSEVIPLSVDVSS